MFSIVMHIACPSLVSFINLLNKNTCLYLQHLYYKISMCVGHTIWQYNVLQCYAVWISSLSAFIDGRPSVFVPHPPLQKMVIIFFEVIVLTEKTESPLQR